MTKTPARLEILHLFERYGAPHPPVRLRDELVVHFLAHARAEALQAERDGAKGRLLTSRIRVSNLEAELVAAEARASALQGEVEGLKGAAEALLATYRRKYRNAFGRVRESAPLYSDMAKLAEAYAALCNPQASPTGRGSDAASPNSPSQASIPAEPEGGAK